MPTFLRLLTWLMVWPWTLVDGLQFASVSASASSFAHPWTFGSHLDLDSCCLDFGLPTAGIRHGEASNPGPDTDLLDPLALPVVPPQHLRVGCSNVCGLRGKEAVVLSQGPGVWSLCETHLTADAQRTAGHVLRSLGTTNNRQIRTHFGAPVALRTGSQRAGTWSGVGIVTDFPGQQLHSNWPEGAFSSGRIMMSRHIIGSSAIQVGTIYGYPSSPTWPKHRELTQALLQPLTRDLVVGSSGPRLIQGDLNCSRDTPGEFEIWRRFGWVEAQELAQLRWQQQPEATCKFSTQVDHIWLSPEAAGLCQRVGLAPLFPDHQTDSLCGFALAYAFHDFSILASTLSDSMV